MSKSKKKKVVVTTSSNVRATQSKIRSSKSSSAKLSEPLVFGKENYKWIAIGVGLIIVGMLLMIGGFNEDPAVWDESKIYGFQRTLLAPVVILTGLAVEIYAIFK
ncbi:MAG: DUF3098 domain-containing protein [Bacteroidia bacterium]|nr:DUF3098 domain-containing protein [Bacteroidia bacterium]